MARVLDLLAPIEIWISLILSLMILSLVIKENVLSRLAQYILVGAVAGYLGVIAIHDILIPQLFAPLYANPLADLTLLIVLALGLLMLSVGMIRIFQTNVDSRSSSKASRTAGSSGESIVRRTIYAIGTIPVVLLLGVGLAASVTGTIQGTLLPQFWRAAELGFAWAGSPETFVSGTITLLITIGVFLHLYAAPAIRSTDAQTSTEQSDLPEQLRMTQLQSSQNVDSPTIFVRLVLLWAGLGKRMLWLAAGVLFARLVASRLSILIAQFEQIDQVLKGTQIWQAFVNLVQ